MIEVDVIISVVVCVEVMVDVYVDVDVSDVCEFNESSMCLFVLLCGVSSACE